jgi:uncharacterized Ntn-hydrolase superfamily protein
MDSEPISALSQVGMIDLGSTPAAFTGSDCIPHAGHHIGVDCAAQANMMVDRQVPEAMVAAFEASSGDLAWRLLGALDAAQAIGGDFRGMQSAGLIVRSGDRDAPVWNSTVVDVRVDDHGDPLHELRRLIELSSAYRAMNEPFVRLAAGDPDGALDAARSLFETMPTDPNAQMRLGVALLAVGDAAGTTILSRLATANEQWITYARRSLQRYGIDPGPLLEHDWSAHANH